MARRTRRNLSDPRIKKIVKHQSQNKYLDPRRIENDRQGGFQAGKTLFLIALLAIVGFGVAFVYINWSDFKSILDISFTNSSTSASEEITNNQKASEASPRTQSNQTITKAEENKEEKTDAKQQQVQTVARRIQVEVLNGCGVDGLAEKITDFLRRNNIDVVSRGNYVHFEVPETKIIDRMGNRDRSQIVADILGVPEDQVETQQNKNLQLDATIILGADYKILKPFIKQGRL